VQDIAIDIKRSRLRTAVGSWELKTAYEQAVAADDERDRRNAIRTADLALSHITSEEECA
jgi:hypothetical protein